VPWTVVYCDTQAGAKRFLDQVRAHPLDKHDPLVRVIMEKLGGHIEVVAQGGSVHADLADFIAFIDTCCLDESCGEGWHRSAAYEKLRAYSSTPGHLKRAVRRKGVFLRIKQFRKKYGERGAAVLRWEFRNWKRIAAKSKTPWKARHVPVQGVLDCVYREGQFSKMNWSTVVSRMDLDHVHADVTDDVECAQNEYLRSVMQEGNHYAMRPPAPAASSAEAAPQAETVNFRLLSTAHGNHRTHLMPTVADAEDLGRTAPLAWNIQWQGHRARDEDEFPLRGDAVEVFDVGDPQWVRPQDVAAFEQLQTGLVVYTESEPSAVQGCTLLSKAHSVRPQCAILDKDCPVLWLIQQLKRAGWTTTERPTTHTSTAITTFDRVEALKFRTYYQCLWVLAKTLPLAGGELPSRAPIAYYKLLLRGIAATSGKPATHYQAILNKDRRKKGKLVEVPALQDEDVPPILDQDEDKIMVPHAAGDPKAPPPKRKSATGRAAAKKVGDKKAAPGGGAGSSGGPGPSAAPLPVGGAPSGGANHPPPPPPPPDENEEEEDRIVAGSDAIALAPKRRKLGRNWVDALCGAQIQYTEYKPTAATKKPYKNYIIKCIRHTSSCTKTCGRNAKNTGVFGELQPLVFLHAWLDVPDNPDKSHGLVDPDPAAVAAFVEAHRGELEALFKELVPNP